MKARLNAGTTVAASRRALRAAQYLRMSTDHQKYSIANQSSVIQAYAEHRGMTVVRTYADEGKSGLRIEKRDALKQLIQDVRTGRVDFATILVYDVSRWGRFQDADESAYYEFMCRQAGIHVEYCAEQFENDGSPIAAVIKAMKRLMAGEYSRELSVKIFTGQSRLATMGFRLGGQPGYAFRRLLVDENRIAKCILGPGDWKSIASDRIILMPGPPEEIDIVQRIFALFVHERKSEADISSILNASGSTTRNGRLWGNNSVEYILRSEKYLGNNVWNRTSHKLRGRRIRNSRETWLRADGAFQGIVNRSLFEAAQAIFQARAHFTIRGRPRDLSNEEMLRKLSELFQKHGYLSHRLINQTKGMPSFSVYAERFGGLQRAYRFVGYNQADYQFSQAARRFSDQEMLARLRRLLRARGFLSGRLIERSEGMPSRHLYERRFGSLMQAYTLIGYTPSCRKHPDRPRGMSDEEMLAALQRLFHEHGRLSQEIIAQSGSVPSVDVYRARFGGLMRAYRLIGLTGDRYAMRSARPRDLTDEEMLEALRNLLRKHGRLSLRLIERCEEVPSTYLFEAHFGSILRAYELIGYTPAACLRRTANKEQ